MYRADEGFAPFQLRGEVDMATASDLRAALDAYAATSEGEVVCDCTDLDFLDSSGIAVLIDVYQELGQLDRGIRLTNVSGPLRRVLEVTGLLDTFGVDSSPD